MMRSDTTSGQPTAWRLALALTVLASGRAMTLAFIGRAGNGGPGDPPEAWLMPLVGDAAIGLTAVLVAVAMVWRPTPATWIVAVAWNAIGAFDALAAYVVDLTTPWPEFFMLEVFGRPMFFAAAAMHAAIIALLARPSVRGRFGLDPLTGTVAVVAQPS